MAPKIAVIFYSTYGTNHAVAACAAAAAKAAGAEVRLLKVKETAPQSVIDGQEAWKAQAAKMADIPEVTPADMEWADGYFFAAPTRFGSVPSQLRAFIDTLGGLWSAGKLSNKTVTATTSAQTTHGGQESTLLSLYTSFMHWSCILIPPGYSDPKLFETGGNPYGYSVIAGKFDDLGKAAVEIQARRLVDFTARIIA